MKKIKLHLNREILIIIYKILHDVLFLFLISFFVMLIAEGVLPGLVSNHISLSKVSIATIFILASIVWLGKKLQFAYEAPVARKNKFFPVFVLLSFLLVGNSLLKFALWENIIITTSTLFLFFLLYQNIFQTKK